MKLKYPKKIIIGSTVFKIIWDKKTGSGSFSYSKDAYIKIGTKHGLLRTLEIVIHELKEIIQIEQSARYDKSNCADEYIFVYTHAEHTDLCARLAGLLTEFIQ